MLELPDADLGDRPAAASDLVEPVVSSDELLRGKLLHVFRDMVDVPGRGHGVREWIKHPGASAVVPLFADGTVALVRQYRHGPRREFLEIPAGKLDPGEAPEACARREAQEETGLIVGKLTPLGPLYPAIGYSDEVIHIFLGEDLTLAETNEDDTEVVRPIRLPFEQAVRLAQTGAIADMKTVAALLRADALLQSR